MPDRSNVFFIFVGTALAFLINFYSNHNKSPVLHLLFRLFSFFLTNILFFCPTFTYFFQVSRKMIFSCHPTIYTFLSYNRAILNYLSLSPPKSDHFVSVVLRTFDFVGIAPGKVNACFAIASFSLERERFKLYYSLYNPPDISTTPIFSVC